MSARKRLVLSARDIRGGDLLVPTGQRVATTYTSWGEVIVTTHGGEALTYNHGDPVAVDRETRCYDCSDRGALVVGCRTHFNETLEV